MLRGVFGKDASFELFKTVINDKRSTLLIDANNCANIHKVKAELHQFENVYTIAAESLYRFIPTLKSIPQFKEQYQVEIIAITCFDKLFNYQDSEENQNIISYAWELIANLSKKYNIIVAVPNSHLAYAKLHHVTKMGHTITSQRMMTDTILKELEAYGKSLGSKERELYLKMLKQPLKHLGSITNASSYHVWAFILLSILIEQEKKIMELKC
jgi:hypothetical protein